MNELDQARGRSTAQSLLVFAVLGVIGILVLPLPATLLDALLGLNLGISVLILLVSLSVQRSLDFTVFPSLLLITTLFRLGLNVAATRLILLGGGDGTASAGHIIQTFGQFAVGGSLIVGAVIFVILLVVNFAVITRGSGRIAEVAARFTLDALPGKQMSIDADLAAGIIDDRQARTRRDALEKEIEFFGAMDGASKFVRGDAIAALVITLINLLGGLAAGLLRDKLSLSAAAETYFILTIGDGLVSQVPALLVSTAAGIIVTRAGSGTEFGPQVSAQVFSQPRPLLHASAVLGALALVPGMPVLSLGLLATVAFVMARRQSRPAALAPAPAAAKAPAPDRIGDLINLDALELEVGHSLLPLIDMEKGGELPGRVASLRRQIAGDLGIVLPPVHLRDNLRLEPVEYRIRLRGLEIGQGTAYPDRIMVLEPSGGTPDLPGMDAIPAKEPAFGLPAKWIPPADRSRAEAAGLTVVDAASVLTTHLSELLRRNAYELVGRQEVQDLLALCAKEAPKLVEDVIPGVITLGDLVRVVRGLLRESLSIRDLRSILEAVADAAPRSKDPTFLVEQVRRRLFRQITARVADGKGVVHALTLDRTLEESLRKSLGQSDGEPTLAPDVNIARRLISGLESKVGALVASGKPALIIAPSDLRRPLFDFASRFVADLWVITARELVPGTAVEPAGTIDLSSNSWSQAA
jgi:flagellar biosynthesis protein FlhA